MDKINVGILGATKGYGYTVLTQIKQSKEMNLRSISSRSFERCRETLLRAGYENDRIIDCKTIEDINNTNENDILITTDSELLLETGITSFIECTGSVELSANLSEIAINKGINVYMVSKETDSVCGPYLNNLAKEKGVVYTLVNGDQPKNAIDLYNRGLDNGFEIVTIGKSSEYDFVWNRDNGDITYTDGSNRYENMKEMGEHWKYTGEETLLKRSELLSEYINPISADLCEMNLVSNITGFLPSDKHLNYPVLKVNELADVLIPKKDGGILNEEKVVDVFYQLREEEEASFSGGEFIIIKLVDEEVAETLKSKGHLVSSNNKYLCVYLPYHIMGLETPRTVLLGDKYGLGTSENCKQNSIMIAIAKEDTEKGTTLQVGGHHHSIDGFTPALVPTSEAKNYAPFYLLNNMVLKNSVKKGETVTLDDVDLEGLNSYKMYKEGLEY